MGRVFSLVLLLLFSLSVADAADTGNEKDFKIKADDMGGDRIQLTCKGGQWTETENETITLDYDEENSKEYLCDKGTEKVKILVKFRTCENCVVLESGTVAGIVTADIVATVLIGVAVYFIASQPRGRSYSNSKASDRQTLLPNQQNDTYMPLSQGHSSEYSKLERRANKK